MNYLFHMVRSNVETHFVANNDNWSLIIPFGLDEVTLLPNSISWTTEGLHKLVEEILIKSGLVKSIPDNPHNTKTNSILLVVIQNKRHSHLSIVY